MSAPFNPPTLASEDFVTHPHDYNTTIPENIHLICGDPMLELQANAINTLANAQIPGTDTWISIIDWLHDLLTRLKKKYEPMFLDTNPSFSIYTQIALSKVERLILPVMADDSSRRAIQNALSLIYGLKLPSEIYSAYAFATKLQKAKRSLPRVHIVAKNRLTQYMGPASAYDAVLKSIEKDIKSLIKLHPEHFTFKTIGNGVVDIRDFQTTGVVAFAKGCPFYSMPTGKLDIGGRRVQVNATNKQNCVEAIDTVTAKLALARKNKGRNIRLMHKRTFVQRSLPGPVIKGLVFASRICPDSRPVPKLGPFEIGHKLLVSEILNNQLSVCVWLYFSGGQEPFRRFWPRGSVIPQAMTNAT